MPKDDTPRNDHSLQRTLHERSKIEFPKETHGERQEAILHTGEVYEEAHIQTIEEICKSIPWEINTKSTEDLLSQEMGPISNEKVKGTTQERTCPDPIMVDKETNVPENSPPKEDLIVAHQQTNVQNSSIDIRARTQ